MAFKDLYNRAVQGLATPGGYAYLPGVASVLSGGMYASKPSNEANILRTPIGPQQPTPSVKYVASEPVQSSGGYSAGAISASNSVLDQSVQQATSQADAQRSLIDQSAAEQARIAEQQKQMALDILGKRATNLQGYADTARTNTEQGYASSRDIAQQKTALSLGEIDDAINSQLGTFNHAREMTQASYADVEKQAKDTKAAQDAELRRQFEARGAIDSTFFFKRQQEANEKFNTNLLSLGREKADKLWSIDNQLATAQSTAARDKERTNIALNELLQNLELKKNDALAQIQQQYDSGMLSIDEARQAADLQASQMASDVELQKLQSLQQIDFNLQNYLSEIDQRRADLRLSVANAASSASGTGSSGYTTGEKFIAERDRRATDAQIWQTALSDVRNGSLSKSAAAAIIGDQKSAMYMPGITEQNFDSYVPTIEQTINPYFQIQQQQQTQATY